MSADVLVVGGGPAGSVTATLLARRGWSVTVLDRSRFPRPKACGECLNPGAVAVLARLGLLERLLPLSPAVLEGWEVRAGGRSARASFPAGGRAPTGLGLPRSVLDASLLDAAREAGARVEEGVSVRGLAALDRTGRRTVSVREGGGPTGVRSARFVVGADGLRSVVARAIAAPARPPRLEKLSLTVRVRGRRACASHGLLVLSDQGTVGLAPVSAAGDLWNLTVVVDAPRRGREVAAGPLGFVLEAAERAGLDWTEPPEVTEGPWASGPFDWPMRTVTARGVALVGDAAGYYDPLTGQGIFRAIRSAELAADAIDRALRRSGVSGSRLAGYRLRHRASFAPGRGIQRVVERVVSSGALREPVVGRLASRPGALSTLIGVTGDATPARRLLAAEVVRALVWPRAARAGPRRPDRSQE